MPYFTLFFPFYDGEEPVFLVFFHDNLLTSDRAAFCIMSINNLQQTILTQNAQSYMNPSGKFKISRLSSLPLATENPELLWLCKTRSPVDMVPTGISIVVCPDNL